QSTGSSPISGTFANLPEGASFAAAGSEFTITYQGGSSHHDVVLTASAGAFSKFVVTVLGGKTFSAGNSFLVTVQAADQFGTPVKSYSGPGITLTTTPVDSQGNFPITGTLDS